MARYNPLDLSTQLCALFDSKCVTIEQFAEESHCPASYIEALTTNPGTRIDWATRHEIGKALSKFHRQYPATRPISEYDLEQRRLKLVKEADNDVREGTPRGVEEVPNAPPGLRVFKSINSRGEWEEERSYRAERVTRQVERRILLGMEMYLDTVDPVSGSITSES